MCIQIPFFLPMLHFLFCNFECTSISFLIKYENRLRFLWRLKKTFQVGVCVCLTENANIMTIWRVEHFLVCFLNNKWLDCIWITYFRFRYGQLKIDFSFVYYTTMRSFVFIFLFGHRYLPILTHVWRIYLNA